MHESVTQSTLFLLVIDFGSISWQNGLETMSQTQIDFIDWD